MLTNAVFLNKNEMIKIVIRQLRLLVIRTVLKWNPWLPCCLTSQLSLSMKDIADNDNFSRPISRPFTDKLHRPNYLEQHFVKGYKNQGMSFWRPWQKEPELSLSWFPFFARVLRHHFYNFLSPLDLYFGKRRRFVFSLQCHSTRKPTGGARVSLRFIL